MSRTEVWICLCWLVKLLAVPLKARAATFTDHLATNEMFAVIAVRINLLALDCFSFLALLLAVAMHHDWNNLAIDRGVCVAVPIGCVLDAITFLDWQTTMPAFDFLFHNCCGWICTNDLLGNGQTFY